MATSSTASHLLDFEAGALLTRLERVVPFAFSTPRVAAAAVPVAAERAIEVHLLRGRRALKRSVEGFRRWLASPAGRGAGDEEAQRRLAFLRLKFNAVLTQFDIFADVLLQRGEHATGVWLAGLDTAAADALRLPVRVYDEPAAVTYLDRGHGAAIRRARTRLPGGGENPVAVIRIPRERMIGSGIASSLVHEVGHQGAALLDLVPSLRKSLRREIDRHTGGEHRAWILWERWISEIVADFWSLAKVGVSATQGLIGVVSLPRAFVYRIRLDDPHPFPWIRVRLSIAMGRLLWPDRQWDELDRMWQSFYPRRGLEARKLRILRELEATLPSFIRLLAWHRPKALRGRRLHEAFDLPSREPRRLRALHDRWRRDRGAMLRAEPTLVFAVLGQAKQDRRLTPRAESRLVAEMLRRWALGSVLTGTELPGQAPPRTPPRHAKAA